MATLDFGSHLGDLPPCAFSDNTKTGQPHGYLLLKTGAVTTEANLFSGEKPFLSKCSSLYLEQAALRA